MKTKRLEHGIRLQRNLELDLIAIINIQTKHLSSIGNAILKKIYSTWLYLCRLSENHSINPILLTIFSLVVFFSLISSGWCSGRSGGRCCCQFHRKDTWCYIWRTFCISLEDPYHLLLSNTFSINSFFLALTFSLSALLVSAILQYFLPAE